jgi:hypothetical protein
LPFLYLGCHVCPELLASLQWTLSSRAAMQKSNRAAEQYVRCWQRFGDLGWWRLLPLLYLGCHVHLELLAGLLVDIKQQQQQCSSAAAQ